MRVLAVEDEATAQQAIARVLGRDADATVDVAEGVAEALERVDETAYDVVVLDHELEDGTGLDVLAAVRERVDRPPVVYLTGKGDEQIARRALSEGAVDYLSKGPEAFDRLPDVVRRVKREWAPDERLVRISEEPEGREDVDGGLFEELMDRTGMRAILVHDLTGSIVYSSLPENIEGERLAARAAAWSHHAGELAKATDQNQEGALGVIHAPEGLIATIGVPGQMGLVGLFGPDATPAQALRAVSCAARIVRDASFE